MSELGDRVKTDVRLPRILIEDVTACAERIGVSKNAFFVIAVSKLLAEVSWTLAKRPKSKQITMLEKLEREIQRIFTAAKKTL